MSRQPRRDCILPQARRSVPVIDCNIIVEGIAELDACRGVEDGAVVVDAGAVLEATVVGGDNGFGAIFSSETRAGDGVARVEDYGGDFIYRVGDMLTSFSTIGAQEDIPAPYSI